ncbi:MAG: queuosine salvage family protein [Candidatus Berkelbacteria bacterium]|nr:queuosine salvage family protein [Candidatus Berkelbacteria bacterium]
MNKILQTTRFVVENSDFVKINHDKVTEFSKDFNPDKTNHWLNAAPFRFSEFSDEQKLHFLFVFDALSFSYWGEPKWTVEHKSKKHDGAWGMILALGRGIEEGVPLTNFEYCANIGKNGFAHILRGNIEIPLFEKRYKIIKEIGTVMKEKFNGKASNLIEEASGNGQTLLNLIVKNFPSFRDVTKYKAKNIYFYKRAQLLVADIYQIFAEKGFGALKNMDQITACADYKLPQILRKLGILEYMNDLACKVDNKIEIADNSPEEIEIRANTIWAVELIKKEVQKRHPQIMSFQINDDLWLATQGKNNGDKPYHRTRTTAY